MPDMSSDQIRDLAVRCVEGFLNNKIPLSEGLAKEASAHDLNFEQIKRACEVTNTVTHLKLLQLSEDRTIEFPLCKVAEVMTTICNPVVEKQAAAAAQVYANSSDQQQSPEPQCKQAGVEFSEHEKTIFFIKEAAANERALELLNDRAVVLQSELVKAAAEVAKDSAWLDKMSSINSEYFAELSVLISGQKAEARDFGGHCMFKEAELTQVNKLAVLYKEARSIVAEKAKRTEMCKKAEELNSSLTKQAFFATAARAVGTAFGKAVAAPMKMVTKPISTAVKSQVKPLFNEAASSSLGKKLNVKPVNITKLEKATKAGLGAGAATGLAAGMDAVTYRASGGPGTFSNGATRDVWDALQH